MTEQTTCNFDPSLCIECMREPIRYRKELGEYVVPVCMKLVWALVEGEISTSLGELPVVPNTETSADTE